ncbi:uncharacterized protein LOC126824813 [Patella vulgata]|uniref:uncharacterized protein LOC126824813 n=1 Tax=Patella vulgata TaxID=6465 RepID=UPI0021800E30|nr:uncharacterized protein LOC126824813 [Patella vulgata]
MQLTEVFRVFSGTILVFGWILTVVEGCDEESVYDALQACQDQREQLSSASGTSLSGNQGNYTQLCLAFRNYVSCMDPRIGNCNGTATSAFKIIKDTYSAEPYSCSTSHGYVNPVQVNEDINIPPKTNDNSLSEDKSGPESAATTVTYFGVSPLLFLLIHQIL